MPPGPEMPGHRSNRDVEVFRCLPERAGHMAILAVLAPESWLVEILAPFEERLRLFADDAAAKGVTAGTHGRGPHLRISDCLMGRFDLVWPSDLSTGRQMAAGARQASCFLPLWPRDWLGDVRLVDVRNLKGLRKVADIARATLLFGGPGKDRKRNGCRERMSRPGGGDVRRK